MRKSLLILMCVGVFTYLIACDNSRPCPHVMPKGPAVVTIDCVNDARADAEQLGNEPLIIEYQQDGKPWTSCDGIWIFGNMNDDPNYEIDPLTIQLCGENKDLRAEGQCGDGPGTFYVRARQGNRSAGPIEVTAERKTWRCGYYYTDKSLEYELSLDVEE